VNLWKIVFWDHVIPALQLIAKKKNISMERVLSTQDITSLFSLPLSEEAFSQLGPLSAILDDLDHSQEPMELHLGITSIQCFKSLQKPFGTLRNSPIFSLAMEHIMPTKAQGFLLVASQGLAEHKKYTEKAKYALRILQLHSLPCKYRGNTGAPLPILPLFLGMLKHSTLSAFSREQYLPRN